MNNQESHGPEGEEHEAKENFVKTTGHSKPVMNGKRSVIEAIKGRAKDWSARFRAR